MKKFLFVTVMLAICFVMITPAYSKNITGQWKKVDSSQVLHFLDKEKGIVFDLKDGKAVQFSYQFLGDDMINIEMMMSSRVQKITASREQLIFSDVTGGNAETYIKYDDKSLPDLISSDYQRLLDRNYPGLCQIKSMTKSSTGEYIVTVEILKDDPRAFGTRGMHISGHRSALFKPNSFVWLKPAGKKGSVDASGMWQSYNPDVAKGDIFQISFNGYF